MKKLEEITKILSQVKPTIKQQYHISELGIFGSYVKGRQTENSDIDILIDYTEPPSLLELMDLELYLSKILGIKADVVTKNGLKKFIKRQILDEVIYI